MKNSLTPEQIAMNETLERESVTELRDIEERLYRLIERWHEAHDAGRANLIQQWGYDAIRLDVAREIIDGCIFSTYEDDEGEGWCAARDRQRTNDRLLRAMANPQPDPARRPPPATKGAE